MAKGGKGAGEREEEDDTQAGCSSTPAADTSPSPKLVQALLERERTERRTAEERWDQLFCAAGGARVVRMSRARSVECKRCAVSMRCGGTNDRMRQDRAGGLRVDVRLTTSRAGRRGIPRRGISLKQSCKVTGVPQDLAVLSKASLRVAQEGTAGRASQGSVRFC